MFFLIHQNNDLTEVSGYAFGTSGAALRDAERRIGLRCEAVPAVVRLDNGPDFPCHVVRPSGSSFGDAFCREGQMTLIAQLDDTAHIAMYLTRRNKVYGEGQVVLADDLAEVR